MKICRATVAIFLYGKMYEGLADLQKGPGGTMLSWKGVPICTMSPEEYQVFLNGEAIFLIDGSACFQLLYPRIVRAA